MLGECGRHNAASSVSYITKYYLIVGRGSNFQHRFDSFMKPVLVFAQLILKLTSCYIGWSVRYFYNEVYKSTNYETLVRPQS